MRTGRNARRDMPALRTAQDSTSVSRVTLNSGRDRFSPQRALGATPPAPPGARRGARGPCAYGPQNQERVAGMFTLRPIPSGGGRAAWAARMVAMRSSTSSGKGTTWRVPRSTCSIICSQVAATHPSLA